jgi:hypothetical protein
MPPQSQTFLIHISLPGKLLCEACYRFVERCGRLRTPEEVSGFLSSINLSSLRLAGGVPVCDNCGVAEDHPTCTNEHRVNRETGNVECNKCYFYRMQNHGVPRNPEMQRDAEWRYQLKQDRENGLPIRCVHCGSLEPLGLKKLWPPSRNRQGVVCFTCYKKKLR